MKEKSAQEKILIVDDCPENMRLLSRILTSRGYEVCTAVRGDDAIHLAQEAKPNLVLLDINMPEMDGYAVCVQLKSDGRTQNLPVIFISALDDTEDKVKAFRAGGVDYISKPFQMEEVLARVQVHLTLQRLRNQLRSTNQELEGRIKELTRSQKKLREREAWLSAFIQALPTLSFIYDEDGRYLETFATETQLLRANEENLKGRLISEVMPPLEAKLMMDAIHHAIETGKTQIIEYKIPVLAGDERWFEGRIAPMETNASGRKQVVFIATEITDRVQLYQEVQRLATQDTLTSCFNRRHFMHLAEQEFQRTLRYGRCLSMLMFDIDHFKRLNDKHGHPAGDRVLCALVALCQSHLRTTDILGRYGGEEFVILMPEICGENGLQAAERLRKEIEEMKPDTPAGRLSVTVSIGVSGFDKTSDSFRNMEVLVTRADQAMYSAKASGRNCTRLWENPGK
jgi:diguanylate cyclase (GGDEF)-like protein/PAS domain S-box-containing protein